jgi:hypothetical protein
MNDASTDKGLIVALVLTLLIVAVWTKEPKLLDAVPIAFMCGLTAIAQRITPKT